jgi:hypothetical protein
MSIYGAEVRGILRLRILRARFIKKAIDQRRDSRFGGGINEIRDG